MHKIPHNRPSKFLLKTPIFPLIFYLGKDQYLQLASEYKCGICAEKLSFDKFVDRYDSDKFLCDICLRTHHMASGMYYCNNCHFDVCHNCPDFLNLQLRRICPKCNHTINHLHALTNPITGNYTCFKCENEYKDVDGVFMCENCEFLLCPNCEKEQRKKKLFKQLQINSRNATPLKKEMLEIISSPQKNSNKFMEKVKKGGFIIEPNTMENEPFSDNIDEHYDLPTFSGKKNVNKQENLFSNDSEIDKNPIESKMLTYNSPLHSEIKKVEMTPLRKEGAPETFGELKLETNSEIKFGEPFPLPYSFKEQLPWENNPSQEKPFLKFQKI